MRRNKIDDSGSSRKIPTDENARSYLNKHFSLRGKSIASADTLGDATLLVKVTDSRMACLGGITSPDKSWCVRAIIWDS